MMTMLVEVGFWRYGPFIIESAASAAGTDPKTARNRTLVQMTKETARFIGSFLLASR
jgi:hypothetical protein